MHCINKGILRVLQDLFSHFALIVQNIDNKVDSYINRKFDNIFWTNPTNLGMSGIPGMGGLMSAAQPQQQQQQQQQQMQQVIT